MLARAGLTEHTSLLPRTTVAFGQVGRAQASVTSFEESGAYMQGCVQDWVLCVFLEVISFQGEEVATQEGLELRSVKQNMQLGEDISWNLFKCFENFVVL